MRMIKAERMKVFLSLLIIVSSVFNSCKSDLTKPEPEGPPSSNGLLPLKAGNTWTYKWYELNHITGEIKSEITDPVRVHHIPEYVKGNYNGIAYEGFSWDIQQNDTKWLYLNNPDGLYQIGALTEADTSINNILEYKYPVKKGESWIVPHLVWERTLKFYFPDSVRYECTDTAAVFQTPLGDFKCYVYSYLVVLGDDIVNKWEYNEYFKPGFGRVGIIIKDYYPKNQIYYNYKMILQSTNLPY